MQTRKKEIKNHSQESIRGREMEVVRKCSGCSAYQYDFLTDKITLKMRQTCSKTPGNPDVQGWKQSSVLVFKPIGAQ